MGRLFLVLAFVALALCLSKDWLGVRDVYIGASEWVGKQMAEMVVNGTTPTPTPTPTP